MKLVIITEEQLKECFEQENPLEHIMLRSLEPVVSREAVWHFAATGGEEINVTFVEGEQQ